ncbi:protein phosphatase 2C domain-containing protein [Brevibacillus laterosporus]|uniref:protein phosphatase 2C domain-containing protein n=1 Tax=Brevibacillus laterosporus TaxID=1465 RepID=UPI0026565416|nr:protein phosphatase 2C domain-containing protein [Brevibacillus laterosporus]MDN9011643.1 protein phosphatase 2C domain-containing protein [Brevibacillus laterosporus]MDO0942643.1 protein phosphatase 2C domain-containing protein [Brevibacillus laterosporus]
MRMETFTSKGIGYLNEDALIVHPTLPLYGVVDGVTSLHGYMNDLKQTDGYLASTTIARYFTQIHRLIPLPEHISTANLLIRLHMQEAGIDLSSKQKLWGAAVGIVTIEKHGISYAQTGDCMIFAVYENDNVRILTRPQVEVLEERTLRKWQEGIEHGLLSRTELSLFIRDLIIQNRELQNEPHGYGVLNGEEQATEYVEYGRINRAGVKNVVIITDGLFWPLANQEKQDWSWMVHKILEMGLKDYAKALTKLEESDPECMKYPRFKTSDDKTGIILTL